MMPVLGLFRYVSSFRGELDLNPLTMPSLGFQFVMVIDVLH